MKKTILAYMAGIMDGEGCISLIKRPSLKTRVGLEYGLRIFIVNTNEWLIQWLKFNFGGAVTIKPAKSGTNHKDCWEWRLSARQAADFLRLIRPYLHLKAAQADLAIQFQNAKKYGRGRHCSPKPDMEWALEEAQTILMHKMNKKGIR